ncbi:hypothetical protein [uncultured Paludibaculum sp.]|uniref:hypothetical protein n=1 Tax=uncultured Paludibaculum sp. TaxID=1765020 RepID=UPI002AAAF351|nr:hypothetical protein [uncultured Paludibaculum sp.]
MKRLLIGLGTGLLAISMGVLAQTQSAPGPHAWGDKDKDGKCDITGQSVGQGRGSGRGMAAGRRGGGCGQGRGCCRRGQAAAAPAAPEAKK